LPVFGCISGLNEAEHNTNAGYHYCNSIK
jgi:hypothetical protein